LRFKELEKIVKENAEKVENDTYKQFLKEEAEGKIWKNLPLSTKCFALLSIFICLVINS